MKYDSQYVLPDFTSKISNKEDAKVIIELGARDCVDTILLEQIYPNAKIYSIECNPNQIDICKENLKKTNRTTFIQKAITNFCGTRDFYIYPSNNPGASSLYKHVKDSMTKTLVDCITGKQLFEEYDLKHINVLNMDIQGSEYEALLSFENYINNIDYIIFEDDARHYDKPIQSNIHRFLERNKFKLIHRNSDYLYTRIL
jgi:FkbM family methyltransferase